ncbi:MAG TPA: hypothetical protein VGQ36_11775 [Thermoanaerobaculia bacterium]|jgi:hypothetical protein|nr:hypothetical protein [Thermoanaerobaculia bacterium]
MFAHARGVFITLLLLWNGSLFAATGHWEGAIHAPQMDVAIAVDFTKDADGKLAGAFDNAGAGVRDFPLSNIVVEGTTMTFEIKAATGGGTFRATLGADGKSMRGTFTTLGHDAQPLELPFELTRTGEASIEATPKSAAITKVLEGSWTGTLEVEGTQRQIALRLSNHADGTATGSISSAGTEIPIARIVQAGSDVTLDVKTVGGSYTGTLDAGGTELAGTWTQGPFSAPLTFRRASIERWAQAVGGREKIAAIRSTYREASIAVGGFDGTIKVWRTPDGKYRKEENVAAFSAVEVFDGVNGTLQQGDAPPRTLAGAELARARSTAFANSGAMFFVFFPERRRGTVTMDGDATLVLKPEGGIDWRVTLDEQTSLPKTMTHEQNGRTITVTFAAYETVDGVTLEKEIHRSTGDSRFDAVIRFTKTVIDLGAR